MSWPEVLRSQRPKLYRQEEWYGETSRFQWKPEEPLPLTLQQLRECSLSQIFPFFSKSPKYNRNMEHLTLTSLLFQSPGYRKLLPFYNSFSQWSFATTLPLRYFFSFFFFFFLLYWGLNSGPIPWATLPALFWERFFWDRVSQTICLGWLWTMILLISASCNPRFTGISHQHPARSIS
jgi:hypothetical protein